MPNININNALSAYQKASDIMSSGGIGNTDETASNSDFSSMVAEVLESSISTMHHSEVTAMKALAGEVSMAELATSVASAETTLRTVIAVRDKVISAYQDIIKMPI